MANEYNNSGSTDGKVGGIPDNLLHPRDYSAPSSGGEQSRGPVGGILNLSEDQTFNNASQGTGIAGPAVWGSSSETASQSNAEAGTSQGSSAGVDFVSGQHGCWDAGRAKK